MNRAEKRLQQKIAKKKAKKKQPSLPTSSLRDHNKLTIQQTIDLAVQHHSAGRLPEAENIYNQILQADPSQPVALHLLGVIARQVGENDRAVKFIAKALAIKPDYADAHGNLGNALKEQGKLDDAVASYREALALKPDYVAVHCNLGVALQEQGKLDDAVASYREALAIKPDYAEAHCNLGNALNEQGKLDDAVASYREALTIRPDYAKAHYNLGVVLKEQGELEGAVASLREALAINPDYANAYSNLGVALKEQDKLDDAVASYREALAINPDSADVHSNLGVALKEQDKLDDAVASYREALAINPDYAEAHSNLGNALKEQGKLDDAVASYCKALTINPDYAEAWNNLKFVIKVLQFSGSSEDGITEIGANGLNAAPHTIIRFALQQFYLDGFRPHEGDESFEKVIAALPAIVDEAIPVDERVNQPTAAAQLPDKVIALLHFGRSGTGLLHSLIDSHPEITTIPGVYLRGYFNEGTWEKLSANGWRELPERFADEFAVLFDARTWKPIPSRLGEPPFSIGKEEGMTSVGENRNEFLFLDREMFCTAALKLMEGMESVDPASFLMVVHAAFEEVNKSMLEQGRKKQLCFYHIHNPDDYAMSNFLRYASDARLLMTVREPIQNCESWLFRCLDSHNKSANRILALLYGFDQVPFRIGESVGVRLEDIKDRPEATIGALCAWMGVEVTPSLYEMTAQGKKWWGDPSSPDYANNTAMSPFDDATTKRPVGAVLSEKDRFVLGTLFYPFSVRFGYREPEPKQFQKDLKEIRPLLDDIMDFEKTIAERSNIDRDQFSRKGTYQLLHAGLIDRWDVLNELGDYPHMLEPLSVP
jgi:tetratricopeptide (TPR) repeat protein